MLSDVESRVLYNKSLRTRSGPEGSSRKQILLCVAGMPDLSWLASILIIRRFESGCTLNSKKPLLMIDERGFFLIIRVEFSLRGRYEISKKFIYNCNTFFRVSF